MTYGTLASRLRASAAPMLIVVGLASGACAQSAEAITTPGVATASPPSSTGGAAIRLPGTADTTQFGWYDNAQRPVLRIRSGDTVAMETLIHGHQQVILDLSIEQMTQRAKSEQAESPGRGPHSISRP